MKTIKSDNKKPLIVLSSLILVTIFLSIAVIYNNITINEANAKRLQLWQDAESSCGELFINNILKDKTPKKKIEECIEKLNLVQDQSSTENFRILIQNALTYYNFIEKADTFFDKNGIFKENITENDLLKIKKSFAALEKNYQNKCKPILNSIIEEYDKIKNATTKTLSLFKQLDNLDYFEQAEIIENINRDQYNEAKTTIEVLVQPNLKNKLLLALSRIEQKISEDEKRLREQLEAERRERERAEQARQAEIAAAWHVMNLPYISQNNSGVFNGCEAASLLMSLKYKGFLLEKDYYAFVEEIPKTNSPQTGFYSDIYNLEPRTEVHWIDTAPLVEFGKNSSGSEAIYDLKGSNLNDLQNEILNDNPVIIYLTFNFNDLKEDIGGVPKNLHVMVLSGYNHLTNEYQITDPWTRQSGQYIFTISGERIEALYNQVGRRAITVKAKS